MGDGDSYATAVDLDGKLQSVRGDDLTMDDFLASVEQRALCMAEVATRNRDDGLELVQEAMFGLVQAYADRPSGTWPPLFYRILQNGIRDWHRHHHRRSRFFRLIRQTHPFWSHAWIGF